jgi:hypothetical protein
MKKKLNFTAIITVISLSITAPALAAENSLPNPNLSPKSNELNANGINKNKLITNPVKSKHKSHAKKKLIKNKKSAKIKAVKKMQEKVQKDDNLKTNQNEDSAKKIDEQKVSAKKIAGESENHKSVSSDADDPYIMSDQDIVGVSQAIDSAVILDQKN